ncbi:DUF5916 domain-containing protein [Nafulsella turpanensis]|uniref:DUF5916 domain-containing protein n=1 Tax=Nafulsella turpanensis TaxID=1265690 RepID=UPI00034901D1|nr:DUF5916 domain-containing protein [Nafulsella turpanensis]
MREKRLLFLLCFILFSFTPFAEVCGQEIEAVRITGGPKIDGIGDDEEWEKVPVAFEGHFTQLTPNNLDPSAYITEIKLAYNDYALYVLARMKDPRPGTIPRELGMRDDFGRNADAFSFILDTYNKGQNAFYFGVTAAGVELDASMGPQGDDVAWDAVWKSAVTFNEESWIAEFEIPYSAIRFPETEVQEWGVNFIRKVQRDNQEATWSTVDNSISGLVNQSGKLVGIRQVDPPIRLQFFPYVSAVGNHWSKTGEFTTAFGGGMDVKYGINESFTLDLSLIPDFSQVQSDNRVLNLGPFEVHYSENRSFFTEGTELFSKGGLLYSRRIGQIAYTFDAYEQVAEGERIISEPGDAQLLNAAKVSGRTKGGLGVGFLNAITDNVYLTIEDSLTGDKRKILIDPVTNFNVMVLDQNLKHNSGISLINTNVTRFNGGRDANVLATEFRLNDKTNTYRLEGFGAYNHIRPNKDAVGLENINGYKYYLRAGKVSGNFQYGVSRNVESDTYNINDLGFLRAANSIGHSLYMGYHIFKPFWILNDLSINFNSSYNQLYEPRRYSGFGLGLDYNTQLKNFWGTGAWFSLNPVDNYDFFEPRREGYFFTRRPSYNGGIWVDSDNRKRLAFFAEYGFFRRHSWNSKDYWMTIAPRFRVSDSFSVRHEFSTSHRTNERGYVDEIGEDLILFGNRDVRNFENVTNLNFIFSNRMGLSLRVRHYWSRVFYDRFFELQKDGSTTDYTGVTPEEQADYATSFNAFNMDLMYRWQVAPGSFLTLAWKDAIYDSRHNVDLGFLENVEVLSQQPQLNTFSVKLTYFVDYLMIKRYQEKPVESLFRRRPVVELQNPYFSG